MATQTIEQYLFEQLNEIAPGKYTLASVLERLESKLRFPCTHLKGGGVQPHGGPKDYNISIFHFADGISEVKCLYGCGLKIRTNTDKGSNDFKELALLPTTNHQAASERFMTVSSTRGVLPHDPGPVPTYTDADRACIQEQERARQERLSNLTLEERAQWVEETRKREEQLNKWWGSLKFPESIIPRQMAKSLAQAKSRPPVLKTIAVFQGSIPVADGVDPLIDYTREQVVASNTKIHKARKTQSRRKTNKK